MTTETWDIPALLQFHRSTFGDLRMEGDEGGEGAGGDGGKGGDGGDAGKTFTQADLDRKISERLTRERAKYSDYDEVKAKAAQYDALEQESKTDRERAVEAAKTETRAEAAAIAAGQRLVGLLVARGMTEEKADEEVAERDLTRYVKDGGIDREAIAKAVDRIAPPKDDPTRRRLPDLGQGNRSTSNKASVAAAKEEYLESRRKRR